MKVPKPIYPWWADALMLAAIVFMVLLAARAQTPHSVRLTWTASTSTGVTYNIYRGPTAGGESLYSKGTTGTAFTDLQVTSGATYFYFVTAANANGESPKSNEVSAVIPQDPPPPPAPASNLNAVPH